VADSAACSLRRAEASDAVGISALVDAAYRPYVERIGITPGPMTEDYDEVIRTRRTTVAERDGRLVGVVVLSITEEGFFVDNVAVHPAHHGTGVGKALLQFAEAEARRAGYDAVALYTHEKMAGNLALYARIGYVEYDRRARGDAVLVYLSKRLDR
jgi:GNAT superfamily N-acetyltransferase